MVNVFDGPLQDTPPPVNTGVTVIVAVTAEEPAFTAENAAMSPVPLAASPMEVVLLVHVYEVAVPPNVTAVVLDPLQTI